MQSRKHIERDTIGLSWLWVEMHLEWVTLRWITALALPEVFVWWGEKMDVNFDMSEYGCTGIWAWIHDKMALFVLRSSPLSTDDIPLCSFTIFQLNAYYWLAVLWLHFMLWSVFLSCFFALLHFSVFRGLFLNSFNIFINFSCQETGCAPQQLGEAVYLHASLCLPICENSPRRSFFIIILPSSVQYIIVLMLPTSP